MTISLWSHQKEAVERARGKDSFALFFEQGTGKSRTTLAILDEHIRREKRVLRTLILCPPIVVENWKREIFSVLPSVPKQLVVDLTGPGAKRAEAVRERRGTNAIFITNYEGLLMKGLYDELERFGLEVLVCDESQKLKDLKSQRTKACVRLAEVAKYRYILSGTPILNSPMDIFSQFLILDKGAAFGRNFFTFRARYFFDKNAAMPRDRYFPNWMIREGAFADISSRIAERSMRVLKSECLDLPPLVRKTVFVDLSAEQAKAYKEMKSDLIAFVNGKACVAQLAITKALRLMQIISGFAVCEEGEERAEEKIKDNPKASALKELLEDIARRERVIVWAVFKEDYATIKRVCEELSLGYVTLTGETSSKDKVEAMDAFSTDPNVRVLIGNPSSGGVGCNLTSASYSIFYSRNFSLEQDLQAEARNYRGGSEVHAKITRIDIVAKNTLDEVVVAALQSKTDIAEKVLEAVRGMA